MDRVRKWARTTHQVGENIVDDVVALIFNSADVFLYSANSVVTVLQSADQELRGATEDLCWRSNREKNFSSFGNKFITSPSVRLTDECS